MLLAGFRRSTFAIGVTSKYLVVVSLLCSNKVLLPLPSQVLPPPPSKPSFSNSSALVCLLRFKQEDIGVTIYGSKVGKMGLHVYSSPVSSDNACGIKSHVIKSQAFFEDTLYISIPSKAYQCTVYMLPFLLLSAVYLTIVAPLLSAERSIEVWTSLLPRLSSLPATEGGALLSSLDLAVDERNYYKTPLKIKRPRLGQSSLKDKSSIAPPIVDPTVDVLSLQPETILPLFAALCERVSSLQDSLENLRIDSVVSC